IIVIGRIDRLTGLSLAVPLDRVRIEHVITAIALDILLGIAPPQRGETKIHLDVHGLLIHGLCITSISKMGWMIKLDTILRMMIIEKNLNFTSMKEKLTLSLLEVAKDIY